LWSPKLANTLAVLHNLKSTEFVNRSCHFFVLHHISKLDYKKLVQGDTGESSHKLFYIILEAQHGRTQTNLKKSHAISSSQILNKAPKKSVFTLQVSMKNPLK